MGNYKFRLSDMIPNAWFYKLRDMSKSVKQNHSHPINKKPSFSSQDSRKSSYRSIASLPGSKAFDVQQLQFPRDQPRKSSKRRGKKKAINKPASVSADFVFQESGMPVWLKPQMVKAEENYAASLEFNLLVASPSSEFRCSDASAAPQKSVDGGLESWPSSCGWNIRSSATDIILDMKEPGCRAKKNEQAVKFDLISKPDLPPILTTMPVKKTSQKGSHNSKNSPDEITEEEGSRVEAESGSRTSTTRKSMSRSGSVKIRRSWARLTSKKKEKDGRKSTKIDKKGPFHSRSVAIVKASFDPENDFKNSMMEMIAENNIKKSKDLEQLLACYLSLNTDQYHDVIIKAFEQIWLDMSELHP